MLNGNAVIQAERSAGIPLTPEMKQFVQANNQGGVTFDGMKAWRAKFADAEQNISVAEGKCGQGEQGNTPGNY